MTAGVGVIVLAKAPVPGLAKTRIAKDVGDEAAADLAAACLLDTFDVVEGWTDRDRRLVALTGDLAAAARGSELAARLESWSVIRQRGCHLGARILHAHEDASRLWGNDAIKVQIGMDSPSISAADLDDLTGGLRDGFVDAALGLAADGGWWGLASRRPQTVRPLVDVPMSRPDTGSRTLCALTNGGSSVGLGRLLRDVDTFDDAMEVAASIPHSHLAEAMVRLASATR